MKLLTIVLLSSILSYSCLWAIVIIDDHELVKQNHRLQTIEQKLHIHEDK
jgi:hypothetical protein